MKKVRQAMDRHQHPNLTLCKLNDDRIKYVLKSSRALKARLMLVDVYLDDSSALTPKIQAVVQELN
jgi:hypothetical protein